VTREVDRTMKTLACDRDKAEIVRGLTEWRHECERRCGQLSASVVVCALNDGYRLLTGERVTTPATSSLPRLLMKWIALYAPVKWPAGISTTPELDQNIGGTRPVAFEADIAQLVQLLETIAADRSGRFAGQLHPIFGAMSTSAWLRWAYLHADHHLRQFGV